MAFPKGRSAVKHESEQQKSRKAEKMQKSRKWKPHSRSLFHASMLSVLYFSREAAALP